MKNRNALFIIIIVLLTSNVNFMVSNAEGDYPVLVFDLELREYVGPTFVMIFTAFSSLENGTVTVVGTFDGILEVFRETASYFVNHETTISTEGLLTGEHTFVLSCTDSFARVVYLEKILQVDRTLPEFLLAKAWTDRSYLPGETILLKDDQQLMLEWVAYDDNLSDVAAYYNNIQYDPSIGTDGKLNMSFSTKFDKSTNFDVKLIANDLAGNKQSVLWHIDYIITPETEPPTTNPILEREVKVGIVYVSLLFFLLSVSGVLAAFVLRNKKLKGMG